MNQQLIGNVASIDAARLLVTALEREDFGTDEISVLFPAGTSAEQVERVIDVQEVQGRGARQGAVAGGFAGLTVGALVGSGGVHWSALRPLVESGLAVSVFLMLTLGVLLGSILGMALGRTKRPRRDARNAKAILVTVETKTELRRLHAQQIFVAHGAGNVVSRAS